MPTRSIPWRIIQWSTRQKTTQNHIPQSKKGLFLIFCIILNFNLISKKNAEIAVETSQNTQTWRRNSGTWYKGREDERCIGKRAMDRLIQWTLALRIYVLTFFILFFFFFAVKQLSKSGSKPKLLLGKDRKEKVVSKQKRKSDGDLNDCELIWITQTKVVGRIKIDRDGEITLDTSSSNYYLCTCEYEGVPFKKQIHSSASYNLEFQVKVLQDTQMFCIVIGFKSTTKKKVEQFCSSFFHVGNWPGWTITESKKYIYLCFV